MCLHFKVLPSDASGPPPWMCGKLRLRTPGPWSLGGGTSDKAEARRAWTPGAVLPSVWQGRSKPPWSTRTLHRGGAWAPGSRGKRLFMCRWGPRGEGICVGCSGYTPWARATATLDVGHRQAHVHRLDSPWGWGLSLSAWWILLHWRPWSWGGVGCASAL